MGNEKSRFLKRDDGTIYDSVTSVTWMANDSFLDLARDVSYSEAEDYVKETNKKKAGGYGDWRIPSIQEASSIFNKEKLNKDSKGGDIFLDSVFPPGAANCTWTSSTRGKEAQIMFYANGCPYWYEKNDKTISHAVRLIRRDN
jgi:serine/threonine-protein kinase